MNVKIKLLVRVLNAHHITAQRTGIDCIQIHDEMIFIENGIAWCKNWRGRFWDIYDLIALINNECHLSVNKRVMRSIDGYYNYMIKKRKNDI